VHFVVSSPSKIIVQQEQIKLTTISATVMPRFTK